MFDNVEYVCPEHFVIHCMLTKGRSRPPHPSPPKTWCQRLYARQLGLQINEPRGSLTRRIYSNMKKSFTPFPNDHNTSHGGIFNFSFSDDGRTLVAATELRKILVLDPLSHKLVHTVPNAHQDCVNFVRFLDTRVIASCSDDMSVKLWDVRSLRMPVNDLRGHEGWVKNVEFSKKNGLLLTSGFDGNIQKWDINKLNEPYDVHENRLWRQSGLMRMQLVPDESKMVICTTDGYLIVVHDLDLNTFKEDLSRFQQPDRFRMLQRNQVGFVNTLEDCEQMTKATRNRVEFITDYPFGHKAEVISSLQVHPYGWSILSRHTTFETTSEWTCVHDIQELDRSQASVNSEDQEQPSRKRARETEHSDEPQRQRRRFALNMRVFQSARSQILPSGNRIDDDDEDVNYDFGRLRFRIENWRRRMNLPSSASPASPPQVSIIETIDDQAETSDSEDAQDSGVRIFEISTRNADNVPRVEVRHPRLHEIPLYMSNAGPNEPRMYFVEPPEMRRYHHPHHHYSHSIFPTYLDEPPAAKYSKPRLMYYLKEPNVGRGFIKELCFSPDGRVVCSPYHGGVRLFAFDESCSELADCVPRNPRKLTQISSSQCGSSNVVSSKFSPTQHLLVTGCLKGVVNFFQPKF